MINIKHAVTAAASVAVAATTVTHIIRNRKQTPTDITETILNGMDALEAYNRAQDDVSRRMMDGYYDDKPDSEYTNDFTILYHNYLMTPA